MALGILGAALAGGGAAMEEYGTGRIKELRDKAMLKMQQEYQTSERVAGQNFTASQNLKNQEFTTSEREAGQGFTMERDDLAHQRTMDRERFVQGQQNARSAASRASSNKGNWTTFKGDDGKYYQFNPDRNETRLANIPEGVGFSSSSVDGGKMTDRQKETVKYLRDQVELAQEKMSDPMTSDEDRNFYAQQAANAQQQIQSILMPSQGGGVGGVGGDGGGDLSSRLAQKLGLNSDAGAANPAEPHAQATSGLIDTAQQNISNREANRQQADQRDEIDSVLREVELTTKKIDGGFRPQGLTSMSQTISPQEASDKLAYLEANFESMTPRQKKSATKLTEKLLQVIDQQ